MNGVVTPASRTTRPEKSFELAIFAAMIAGACTFLNVYCTQPLLPFFQRLFHASEIEVRRRLVCRHQPVHPDPGAGR